MLRATLHGELQGPGRETTGHRGAATSPVSVTCAFAGRLSRGELQTTEACKSAHTPTPGWRRTLPQPSLGQCSLRELPLVASDLSWEGPSAAYGTVAGRGRDDWAARAARSACWEGCDMFLAGEGREEAGETGLGSERRYTQKTQKYAGRK